MLKSFLKTHGTAVESVGKAAAGGVSAYVMLSGAWAFTTIAAAVAAITATAGEIRKLQEHAEKTALPDGRKKRLSLLLSLAAREAYMEAVADILPKTLADWQSRGVKPLGSGTAENDDVGPECDVRAQRPLVEMSGPTFDFLEGRLLSFLQRAEVPTLERCKLAAEVRREAESVLGLVVAESPTRYGGLATSQMLAAADSILASRQPSRPVESPTEQSVAVPLAPVDHDAGLSVSARPTASPTGGKLVGGAEDVPKLPEALRKIYEDRFAQARRELDAGSMPAAEQLFAALIAELRAIGSPDLASLLTRCLHNRAVALYNNNQKAEAVACFEEAIQSPHQTPRTQLGRFYVPHARGDFIGALAEIRKLRTEYPAERDFAVNEADCLVRLNELDRALGVLEENPSENEAWFTLQSQLLSQVERYAEARDIAETGLRLHPKSAQLKAAVAFAEAKPLFDRLHVERAARRFPSTRDATVLQRLLGVYADVVTEARRAGVPIIEAEAHAMMGAIHLALRAERAALPHFDACLAISPHHEMTWVNKHAALVRLDEFEMARTTAREAAAVIGTAESLGREAATLIEEGKPEFACDILDEAFRHTPDLKQDDTLRMLGLQALASAGRTDQARQEAIALVADPNCRPKDVISAAEVFSGLGDFTQTDELIARAEAAATGDEAVFVRQVAGLIYYRRENWSETIKRLGADGMDPVESMHVEKILLCLINLEDVRGAVLLAERLRALGRGGALVNRALTHCYVRIGREAEAEPLLRELVEQEGRFRDRVALFQVVQRLQPLRKALPILEEAVRRFPDEAEGHLFLSGAYYALHQYPLSLAEARKAHALAPDEPATIRNFAWFLPAHLDQKMFTREDRKIIQKLFADRTVFKPIEIPEKDGELDLTNMLAQLRERREHGTRVMELRRARRLPLAFAAEALGHSVFSLWWSITRSNDERLFMANGDAKEQAAETETCANASVVVVDASALFTLAEIGLLDLLTRCFERVHYDTQTLIALKQEQMRLAAEPAKQTTAFYHEGRLVLSERDPEEHAAKLQRLEEIISFLHHNERVTPRGPSPEVWAEFETHLKVSKVKDCFAAGTLEAASVAKSEVAAYYCDEFGLRHLLGTEFGLKGFSTQILLRRAVHTGHLEPGAYDSALTTLLRRNYHFVSVDRHFIADHLHRVGFVRERIGERLLREIGSTTFGRSPGSVELGLATGLIWFNSSQSGTTSKREWMSLIAENVPALKSEKAGLLMFCVGMIVELRHFPEAFIGLSDMLIYELGLPHEITRRLQFIRRRLIDVAMSEGEFAEPGLSAKWRRAIEAARHHRMMAGGGRPL